MSHKHDPEKWLPVFGKDHAQNKEVERDDDSTRSHRALAAEAADGSALDRLADTLLRSDVPADLREAARDIHSLLLAAAMAGRPDETLDPHDTVLPDGDAISPESAARCVLDYTRTSQFLRGMRLALQAALERFSERPLDILYAGCGPFAPLGLLLTHCFSPLDVRFTLIDIHELSLSSARRVFEAFGRGEFIGDCWACDAATYRHPTAMHVVIAETMQRALQKEPQVAVILNLAPQLKEGGILVPEAITVRSALYDARHEFGPIASARIRIDLGPLLELDAENARDLLRRIKTDAAGARSLPQGCLRIPAGLDPELRLMLRTSVKVFGPAALDDYDSGITYPVHLHKLGSCGPRRELAYCYRLGCKPGFDVWWPSSAAPSSPVF
ncbi:MAG: hypothetical protein ACJ8DE_17980 [Microvirga sp.]